MCTQIRRPLLRGLLLSLACVALGWPVANADETIAVATEQELNHAIKVVSAAGPGTHTITLLADIVRTGSTPTLVNPYAEEVIIDGAGYAVSGGGIDRVFSFTMTVATLRNITMTDGYAAGEGGGLLCAKKGTLTIENARVANSHAVYGGGVYASDCNLHLAHVVIEDNSAKYGGGVWIKGAAALLSAMETTIRGNTADYTGGGIAIGSKDATLSDTFVEGNTSQEGGGIWCSGGAVKLLNSQVIANQARAFHSKVGYGGGLYVGSQCAVDVIGTTLSDNVAVEGGGGIRNQPDGAVFITGSTLAYNDARMGGAIDNYGGYVGIVNSTFSGNASSVGGGVIANRYVLSGPNTILMEYTTVAANMATVGGGALSSEKGTTTRVLTSILDGNSPQNCYGKEISSKGHNLSSDQSCPWYEVGDVVGTYADLGILADNGGPTLTHALNRASPALDRIPHDGVLCGGKEQYGVDQRGVPRPQPSKGACDKGAYERIPNNQPICDAAYASPLRLWPPNHKFEPVEVLGVIDPDGDALAINVGSVVQDEPVDSEGDGSFTPDAVIEGGAVTLRAERMGGGDGRVYRLTFRADDGHGGLCKGSVDVGVPHDPTEEPVAGEIWYDSTLEW
jgi:hypothetical protein